MLRFCLNFDVLEFYQNQIIQRKQDITRLREEARIIQAHAGQMCSITRKIPKHQNPFYPKLAERYPPTDENNETEGTYTA